MTCKSCGKEIADNLQFCTECGATIKEMTQTPIYTSQNQKSRIVAGLLGIFLGSLGLHNFYLGHIGKGILNIALSILLFGLGGIWGFIEGILILMGKISVDANNIPLKD